MLRRLLILAHTYHLRTMAGTSIHFMWHYNITVWMVFALRGARVHPIIIRTITCIGIDCVRKLANIFAILMVGALLQQAQTLLYESAELFLSAVCISGTELIPNLHIRIAQRFAPCCAFSCIIRSVSTRY